MKAIISLTVLLVLLTGSASQARPHGTRHHNKTARNKPDKLGTAYFIEFEAETVVAVTAENINMSGDKVALEPYDLATLRDILSHHQQTKPAEFGKYKVRVRIQDEKRNLVAVVDQQGVVIENGRRFSLTPLAFVELYSYLKYILNGRKP